MGKRRKITPGLDFMDWLHKIRRESEEKRKRRGISGAEWLKEIGKKVSNLLKRQTPQKETHLIAF